VTRDLIRDLIRDEIEGRDEVPGRGMATSATRTAGEDMSARARDSPPASAICEGTRGEGCR
jgi:hypothetical protein